MIFALLLILVAGASSGMAQDLNSAQLTAWQDFFDATQGTSWTKCKGKRSDPCSCSGSTAAVVTCVVDGDSKFIQSVVLKNIGLTANNYPVASIDAIISGFPQFTLFDVTGNPNLKNRAGGCLNVPSCNNNGVTCALGPAVCPPTSPTASASPTPERVDSITAWTRFFNDAGGSAWTVCKATEKTPCDCQRNQPNTAPVRVLCNANKNKITRVSLINNNLVGSEVPDRDIGDLILAGATYIDLTQNPDFAPGGCFDIPECSLDGVTCNLPWSACGGSQTGSPSVATQAPAGTTTGAPTPAGSATVAPSPAVTRSPSSATQPPSVITLPPASSNNTDAPATESSSPTSSPSSGNITNSPTAPTTRPPTVGTVTGSPTTSSSSKVALAQSAIAAFAIGVAAIVA